MKRLIGVIQHRRSILLLFALLALAGGLSAWRLPVTLFPNVAFPRVQVTLDAGDRPAEQMALQVTVPVEEVLRRVPEATEVRSTTSRGSAEISVYFPWGLDMVSAALQVNAAISQILPTLPPGTTLLTRRMDPTVFPIIAYSLSADTVPLTRLLDIAQYQLRPRLSAIPGVANVQPLGGALEEYQVSLDPDRLVGADLSLDEVVNALKAANQINAVGRLEQHYKLYLAITNDRLTGLDEIRRVILRSGPGGILRVGDVAEVKIGPAPQWIRVNADGHDAVLLNIYQQPGGNSVRIAHDVETELHRLALPAGVHLARWYDQSELVVAAATSVRDAILVGTALAAVVLFVFLRSLRVTLIALLVVPAVLLSTVLVLRVLGMSFNLMTLGGMAAAVGLIIDDAIVMLEQLVRHLHQPRVPGTHPLWEAARRFRIPLLGSSAATLVIFIPLAFLDGVSGAFFKALSVTMAASLFLSLLFTALVVPLLAERWLTARDEPQPQPRSQRWLARLERGLERGLKRPLIAVVLLAPLLGLGGWAYTQVGSGFMPTMDEGGFVLDYRSAPGTSLTETDRLLRQVESLIRQDPAVATYSRRTGAQLGGGITEANQGDFFIKLKSGPRDPIETVMDRVRHQILTQVPGLDIELAQLMEDMIGDLTSVPEPVEIKLYGPNQSQLEAAARASAEAIARIPGVVDIKNGITPAGDALEIRVDRDRAALEGVDPALVSQWLDTALAGTVATQVQSAVKMIDVRVWWPPRTRNDPEQLRQLLIRAPDGHRFALGDVATLVPISGQPEITRDNLQRMVAVTARLSGRDLGSAIHAVRRTLTAPGFLPGGVDFQLGGLFEQQQEAFKGLMLVFGAAMALVFLLLMLLYERFLIAFSVLAMPLLALPALFVGLWITDVELNISALMGMTMIVGIVTEVGIFYFSEYVELARTLPRETALLGAMRHRARPIAMTTLAAILTLLPLALGWGEGSQMQQPLAIVIIAGLMVQLPLVLFVMPILYHSLERLKITLFPSGEDHANSDR